MNDKKNEEFKCTKIKKFLSKIPHLVKYIVLVIIILVIFYFYSLGDSSFISQTKTTKFGLEDVGELVTQTCYLTEIEDNKEHKEFFNLFEIPFTESRQIFSYDIEVDASVDFSKISYSIDDKKKEIVITLPHSEIYKTTLNNDSLKVYLDSGNLFSRIDLEKHNDAINEMKEQGINDAKANGILDSADTNAQKLIEGFIKSNKKYDNYNLVYKYI